MKIGSTYSIRKPNRYSVTDGATLSEQDTTEATVALTIDKRKHVGMSFTQTDMTLKIQDFRERFIAPAMLPMANQVDVDCFALYKDIFSAVGTAGTTPTALKTYLQAKAQLNNNGVPVGDLKTLLINPDAEVEAVDFFKGLFNSQIRLDEIFKKGMIGKDTSGYDWYMTQNIPTHTIGAWVGTPLVNGSTTSGATTLVTDGWTGSVTGLLKKGDIFTIAGVYAVNPQTKATLKALQQFVVTADTNSSSGAATIPVYPAIISSGAYQTVSALPADNAAITVLGAASTLTPQNLAFHKNAFTLACVDLEAPDSNTSFSRVSDKQTGLSISMTKMFDINNYRNITRLDILYGCVTTYPELASRIYG